MILLAASAAFVGLVHSLAPGHWLPVVLMAKSRQWSTRSAIFGALMAASGHIAVSVILGVLGAELGAHFFMEYEHEIESYSGLGLVAFGLFYALYSFKRHSHCHGHEHHGPDVKNQKGPFLFLFSLGFSPCLAVLPVFAAAAPMGIVTLGFTMLSFSGGVIGALVGATLLVSRGLVKLDHPVLEHYGDVITGVSVALIGLALFLFPHVH